MTTIGKITYTTANVDMEAFHREFDRALDAIRSRMGRSYPLVIGGTAVESLADAIEDRSPIDPSWLLGTFSAATVDHVDQAVGAAKKAQAPWGRTPWPDRLVVMRRAAGLIRERRFELAALMSLEVGKNRMESIGDAEEAADLIDYYAAQMEEANGFVRPMHNLTSTERNTDVQRPYGVFACIAPFNFPLALAAGMSGAALIAGNSVVFKPAEDTCWTGYELLRIYQDAGVPPGVFNFLTGHREEIGDALWQHPEVDGVVFTGSKQVGMRIFRGLSEDFVKPCLMELGGKNATVVMPSADLDAAAEGVMKSAFGLQNQKCSATSRVYVHRAVAEDYVARLLEKTKAITMGDPTRRDVWFGPVINERALGRYLGVVEEARAEGDVLTGGQRLTGGEFDRGYFVAPTVARLPLTSRLFFEEFFVPFLAVGVVDSLDQAVAETNLAEYGLTAGLFSKDQAEIDRFLDTVEAGVCYVNKRTGATTGAWPGSQPFCGWKGSGSSGKGGCGPYYLQQFMREQSRTIIVQ
ncbi:MAG: aldehyde dehydrogenase family protein [Gemmatimonadales bacterium]